MRGLLLYALWLGFTLTQAQHSDSSTQTSIATASSSISSQQPSMSGSSPFGSVATVPASNGNIEPEQGNSPGGVNTAGASGSNTGFVNVSRGAMVAIIVVVVVVSVVGSKWPM